MNELLTNTTYHVIIVEVVKIILWVVVPISLAIFMYGIRRLRNNINNIKLYLRELTIKWKFKRIFDIEKHNKLRETYIDNALNEAKSTDEVKKRNAIAQLSQFGDDKAINGLIAILAIEKDLPFKKIMIEALYSMIYL